MSELISNQILESNVEKLKCCDISDSGNSDSVKGGLNSDVMDLYQTEDCERQECKDRRCCTMTELPVPAKLKDLVRGLQIIFEHDRVNIEFVKHYMNSYKSNKKDWKKFALFDPHRYTRNLVDTGNDKYNLIVLCWNLSQGSSIHSHAGSHCFMKVLDGTITEEHYNWPSDSEEVHNMEKCGVDTHNVNATAYISDDLGLHRVANDSNVDYAVTLHLYSPPINECAIFDEKTGHQNCAKMTFWSKYGQRTPFGKEEVPENN